MVFAGSNAHGTPLPEPEGFTPDLRRVLAAATLPKFVAVGERDLWPLALHRHFAQSIGAWIAVHRGGHSPARRRRTRSAGT